MIEQSFSQNISAIDIMGPLLDMFATKFDKAPRMNRDLSVN